MDEMTWEERFRAAWQALVVMERRAERAEMQLERYDASLSALRKWQKVRHKKSDGVLDGS